MLPQLGKTQTYCAYCTWRMATENAIYGLLEWAYPMGQCLRFAFHMVLFLCPVGTILFGEHYYFTGDNC